MNESRFRWIISIVVAIGVVGSITLGILYGQTSGKLDSAQEKINSLTSQVSVLSSNINSLEATTETLNELLDSANQQIGELNAKTAELLVRSTALTDSVAEVLPSVVYIEVEYTDPDSGQIGYASGSGVIMSEDGYILTNKHVVADSTDAIVILKDRRIFYVSNIWEDDILDLAVVKIEAPNLVACTFGDPTEIQLGNTVVALGFPLGMSPEYGGATVTSGIVSNLERSFFIENDPYYDLIQTDAAINPGNSGGPLINLKGEVIGINSAGAISAQNIGYAINVATARHVYEDIVEFGEARHPYLGIFIDDYYEEICGRLGCIEQQVGAIVADVETSGPAADAGLMVGDVVIALNGEEVLSAADFIRLLWRYDSGNSIEILVQRGVTEVTVTLTLPNRPTDSSYL